tara:strand:+ start:297 stop:590 length:294 start_codon:yes stop_codon:yes gene_type:complete
MEYKNKTRYENARRRYMKKRKLQIIGDIHNCNGDLTDDLCNFQPLKIKLNQEVQMTIKDEKAIVKLIENFYAEKFKDENEYRTVMYDSNGKRYDTVI